MPFPTAAFKKAVRFHSTPLTVHRRQEDDGETYGTTPEYDELADARSIFVSGMEESQQPTDAGENQSQRLTFYTAPDVDLQENDRVEYHGQKYEVLVKTGHPNENDPAVQRYELDDV